MLSRRQAGDCRCAKLMEQISEVARLKEALARKDRRIADLERQLGKVTRTALEQPFGLSTPSSKRLVKPNAERPETEEERLRRRGGAKSGHPGHGWKRLGEPEEVVELPDPEACPHCHGELVDPPFAADEERDVVVERPVRAHVRRYRLRVRYCPRCGKPVRARAPGVMDGCRYANSVVARAATEFYLHGIPAGVVSRTSEVDKATLLGIFNRVADVLRSAREGLLGKIRSAPFAQGDETGWRTDGDNGWAWVFVSGNVVVFACAGSRGSAVAKEALAGFDGLYLTDRYRGYAFIFRRAFCLEHLRRDALKIADENPEDRECLDFANAIVPVLKRVMGLRREFGEDPEAYRREATAAAADLHEIVTRPARHPDVQKLQDVFRDARLQCWQWLVGPQVPAENNRSEREVRPLATARKVSHGSQSERGARTRETFMSVLHTLKACGADPAERLERALDAYAADPGTDVFEALFGGLDFKIPVLPRKSLRKLPAAVTRHGTKGKPTAATRMK
jgi:transposase